jgi:hypothetical protein
VGRPDRAVNPARAAKAAPAEHPAHPVEHPACPVGTASPGPETSWLQTSLVPDVRPGAVVDFAEPRDTLLPPDLFNRFVNDAFWRDPKRIPEGLRVV